MSKVAAAGAVNIQGNVAGKRLGLKKFGGEVVANGNIIVRQNGTKFHPGRNTKLARNHSIYAVSDGVVAFRRMTGHKRNQFYIDVVSEEQYAEMTAEE